MCAVSPVIGSIGITIASLIAIWSESARFDLVRYWKPVRSVRSTTTSHRSSSSSLLDATPPDPAAAASRPRHARAGGRY